MEQTDRSHQPHHERAAPADTAGHMGSKAVDENVRSPASPRRAESEDRSLPTNQDTTYRGSPKAGWILPITLTLLFLLLVFAFARF